MTESSIISPDLRIVVPSAEPGPIYEPKIFGLRESRNLEGEIPTTVLHGFTRVSSAKVDFTRETPDNLIDEPPVIIIQGFMGPQIVYDGLREALAQLGRDTITVGRAGFQTPCAAISKKHRFTQHKVTAQTPWAVQNALKIPKVHAVAHSMGVPITFNKAVRRPERFASVTSLGGAGLTGHGVVDLGLRLPQAAKEIKTGIPAMKKAYGFAGIIAVGKYFAVNPARPIFEAIDVSRQDIRSTFPVLKEKGVPTAVGAFINDAFFDEEVVEREVGNQADVFRRIHAELAGHIAPQLEPELVAWEIDEMIREMTDLANSGQISSQL